MITQRIYKIFVASPSEVEPERQALGLVIQELNDIWANTLQVHLQLVKWENSTYPGIDADPQSVINKQIEDNYEIFIGILWSRFGTATPRYESGTQEEFQKAYERYVQNCKSVKIMFYFKDMAIPPSKIDTNQLHLVKKFKKQISDLGCFYWTFEDLASFEKFVRMHLSMFVLNDNVSINNVAKIEDLKTTTTNSNVTTKRDSNLELDEGFLNLIQEGMEQFERNTSISIELKELMEKMTDKIVNRTQKLNELGVPKDKYGIAHATQIIDGYSIDMDAFSERLDTYRKPFYQSYVVGIESFGRAMLLLHDFPVETKEQLSTFLATISSVKSTLLQMKIQFISFRDSITKLPQVTTSLNKSKRKTFDSITAWINDLDSAVILTSELENSITPIVS